MIKLLIVDDSALMRRELTHWFEGESDFEIHQARNGAEAVRENVEFQPDVVTLDVNMPEIDGITALSLIMAERPVPVVMVSSLTRQGALATLEALNLGAVDYIAKPGGTISLSMDRIREETIQKVRAAVKARPKRRPMSDGSHVRRTRETRRTTFTARREASPFEVAKDGLLLVGASTGGPQALETVLTGLPANFPWPVVVAQHMSAGITKAFAQRLDQFCNLKVCEVASIMPVERGTINIARGGADLLFATRAGRLVVVPSPEDPNHLWHPSVELLGQSALQHCNPKLLTAVMLTGMGHDGSEAFAEIKRRGGRTIAEAEDSAVVWGMPAELVRKEGATLVLSVEKIAGQLKIWSGKE